MELVYLWVEKYKNIHEQGFNFSPRFNCDFDVDSNELTIDENDDYIENFFGDNINVTAIVGKNGSGKSSVLEFILDRLANRDDNYPKNFIFIYSYKNQLYKYSNFQYLIIPKKVNIVDYPNVENLLNYYKDIIALHINSEYKDIESRDTQQIFSENNKYDKRSSNLVFIENYINNSQELKNIKETIFTPHILKISIKTRDYYRSALHDDRDFYTDEDWEKISNLIGEMEEEIFIERIQKVKKIFEIKYSKHKNNGEFTLFDDRIQPYKYIFDKYLLKKIPKEIENCKDKNFKIIINDIDKDLLIFIQKLPYVFEIDIFDKNNINIVSLSFGEKQLLTQLHYIVYHAFNTQYQEYIPTQTHNNADGSIHEVDERDEDHNIEYMLVFIDEFEIGLHPQWQKKTINYIVNFLKDIHKKIHIILTSHSPFLLSDIPKQNIIFLDTYEDGKCKVLKHDEVMQKKQTFGANIHTLLSDSFFMEDGLMGEFAKGKINEIIDFHNITKKKRHKKCLQKIYENREKGFRQTQSIVGDPYLKQVLENHLLEIDKFFDKKVAKEKLKARLQKQLAELDDD